MATQTTTTTRPARNTKTMGASVAGHAVGVGGNAALWAVGTYGWGVAAAIGGGTALAGGVAAVRRRKGRGRSTLGTGRGGSSLFGRSHGSTSRTTRSGTVGTIGRRPGGVGRPGGGGFLRKLAGGRSLTPKRGGGIPGRGSTSTRNRGPISRGLSALGSRLPGSRSRNAAGSPVAPGSRRSGRGGAVPGGGTRRGLFNRGAGAGGGGGKRGGQNNSTKPGSKSKTDKGASRSGGLFTKLNPFNRGKKGPSWGQGKPWKDGSAHQRRTKQERKADQKKRKADEKARNAERKQQKNAGGGARKLGDSWEQIPESHRMKLRKEDPVGKHDQTPMPARKSSSGTPPMPTRGGAGGQGGGNITQAAEELAGTMGKPGQPINTVKGMDRNLGDLAGALGAIAGGVKNAANGQLQAMPDEIAAHERLMQLSTQVQKAAQEAALIQADQRRRNAPDHERLDNSRKNEKGYDWQSNNNE